MQRMPAGMTSLFLAACLLTGGRAGAAAQVLSWPLSKEMLRHAQLELVWQENLAVAEGEQLDTMTVLDDRLYVRSNQNYVWSLDRRNGRLVFDRSIAPAGFPLLGWTAYDDTLITVIDNQLVELDKNTGSQRRIMDLELSIVAPPVRNSQYFYVSAADRRLHVFRADDMVRLFRVAADNNSLITSILADDDLVVLGTDAGNLIGMMADAAQKRWQFDAGGPMAGPVVSDGRCYFLASKDTQVYRVDVTGPTAATMAWRYQTEAILDREPRATATVVYQYAVGRGLNAIGKQSGQALWVLPEGIELLAEAGGRAYVTTKLKTLAVMDNATGSKLYSVNLAKVTRFAANTLDANIYVADEQGRVACLCPAP
ncbi:MAG: PQQ-binding-like beta-propeller repeat protein [Sedimentisphaerales bacterium]|nr:PQQ-binding-like beta-propeller repeat protein [Sedimentisphaerales bacterium]